MKFRKTIFSLICLLSSIANGANNMDEIPGKIITLEALTEMFENIDEQGQWDITKDLVWGYFFTDSNPEKLEEAARELDKLGYRFVDIFLSEKDEPNEPDSYWLHVEKIETHTPESLDKRNDELYLLAAKLDLKSYDGMDVGPAGK